MPEVNGAMGASMGNTDNSVQGASPLPQPKPQTLNHKIASFEPANDEEMSAKELKWSWWFATHKQGLHKIIIAALLVFIVITLGYGLYGIGAYLFFGLQRDLRYERELARVNPNVVAFLSAHRPADVIVGVPDVFDADTDTYDLVTRVENPNVDWFITIDYHYTFNDATTPKKRVIVSPGTRTVLYELSIKASGRPQDPRLVIDNAAWTFLSRHTAPDPVIYVGERTNFVIADAYYKPGAATELIASNQIHFTITNNTPYSYWRVDVPVLLLSGSRTLGIVYTKLDRFISKETRTIDVRTTKKFGQVSALEPLPDAHIFDAKNYLAPGE